MRCGAARPGLRRRATAWPARARPESPHRRAGATADRASLGGGQFPELGELAPAHELTARKPPFGLAARRSCTSTVRHLNISILLCPIALPRIDCAGHGARLVGSRRPIPPCGLLSADNEMTPIDRAVPKGVRRTCAIRGITAIARLCRQRPCFGKRDPLCRRGAMSASMRTHLSSPL